MFKHLALKLKQVHKRKGFLAFSLAVIIVLISLSITMLAYMNLNRVARTTLLRLRPDNDASRTAILGSGIDIASLPGTNMLQDPSFEPYVIKTSLTVEDGTDSVIMVPNDHPASGLYGEGFFDGGDVRVAYQGESGVITKKTAKVVRYSPDQIAPFVPVPVTGDIQAASRLLDIAVKGDDVVAVGEYGMIITGINGQAPVPRYSGVNTALISVASNSEGFFACTAEGVVLASSDGVTWESWIPPENVVLNSLAVSDAAVVAACNEGRILLGYDGTLYVRDLGIPGDITDVIYDGKRFVAVTSEGEILISDTGVIWKIASGTGFGIDDIEYADSVYMIVSRDERLQNHLILVYNNIEGQPLSSSYMEQGIADAAVLSGTKALILGIDGKIYESTDYGVAWKESAAYPPEGCSVIETVGEKQIICSAGFTDTHISRLVTEIEIDSPLQTGKFQAGEFCFLSVSYPELPEDLMSSVAADDRSPWEFYGRGKASKGFEQSSPSGGEGIIELYCGPEHVSGTGHTVISQPVTSMKTGEGLLPGGFYVFSVWIKQESISQETVKVWLSGDYENFGTEFSNIGTQWNKYTYKFPVPRNVLTTQAYEIRLNIGITGQGRFYFDDAYLGHVDDNEDPVPGDFRDFLAASSPSVVRISWLGIGSESTDLNSWAFNGQLEEGLALVKASGENSAPWITVDSYASEAEIRNLLEYLAGPISSNFGSIRHRGGSPIPWSSRFEKIYIEFTDSSGIYERDIIKAAYLNSCIQTIESSPYYQSLRNNVVLVDGMVYSDGLMLSRADYFSLDYGFEADEVILKNIRDDLERYVSLMPRNPERPADTPIGLMKSTDWGDGGSNCSTADITVFLLDTLGKQTAASLLTWQDPYSEDISGVYRASARILSYVVSGEYVPLVKETSTAEESALSAYAYASGSDLTFIVASHENTPSAVAFDVPFEGRTASLIRFDHEGRVVEQRKVRRSNERINVMPGNVVVYTLENTPPGK